MSQASRASITKKICTSFPNSKLPSGRHRITATSTGAGRPASALFPARRPSHGFLEPNGKRPGSPSMRMATAFDGNGSSFTTPATPMCWNATRPRPAPNRSSATPSPTASATVASGMKTSAAAATCIARRGTGKSTSAEPSAEHGLWTGTPRLMAAHTTTGARPRRLPRRLPK